MKASLARFAAASTRATPEAADVKPVRMLEVDIGQPLPALSAVDERTGQCYERALALVRLHTQPLGLVDLRLVDPTLTPDAYADQVWRALRAEISAHLRQDGLPVASRLPPTGLSDASVPVCLRERERFLANAPFVSVVVATRDRPESLDACLRSLLSLHYPCYEIIVVDNAPSTPATAALLARSYGAEPRVRYVREDWPGLAAAHNRGLRETRAEIIAITDDDVLVDRYWLAELVKGFSVTERVACVTGMILPLELETPAQLWIEQYGGFSKGFHQRVFDQARHRPRSWLYPYAAGMFGSGANMAFKTAALRELGGFDPALGAGTPALGGDDLAAFFQVVTTGYTLVYEPTAIVRHRHRPEYTGLRKQAYGYGMGLTAYLTKALFDQPGRLLDFAVRIPSGLVYALSARSPKNRQKRADYPRELTIIERQGMLHGPVAYLRSRRHARAMRTLHGPLEQPVDPASSVSPHPEEAP